jgi:hypothetical protein
MSTEINSQPKREDGYERRDANVRTLLIFAGSLALLIIIVLFAMRWTFEFLSAKEPLGPTPTPFEDVRALPPQPRLQVQPHQDLKDYCQQELSNLKSYGWVDPQNGIVRIPVEVAMQKVLQQGLPVRPAGEATSEAESKAPVGSVNAPQPVGAGGPCYFITERRSAVADEKAAPGEEKQ